MNSGCLISVITILMEFKNSSQSLKFDPILSILTAAGRCYFGELEKQKF